MHIFSNYPLKLRKEIQGHYFVYNIGNYKLLPNYFVHTLTIVVPYQISFLYPESCNIAGLI